MIGHLMGVAVFTLSSVTGSSGDSEPRGETAEPAGEIRETVVVTASRVEEPEAVAVGMVTVLGREELAESPALVLDEALRQVPGFGLFRRSSSLSSHPTTQGVSLRGIGPSGAGRTLVLFDGIPWNDPFGGWVYWSRVPRLALERVEVARGGGSALWGSWALGGVIQLLPRPPRAGVREAVVRVGERDTYGAEAFASGAGERWGWTAAGSYLDAPGHFLLRPEDRGPVDRPAGATVGALAGRLHRGRYHAGVQLYRDRRENGTALQENDTEIALAEGGYRGDAWAWTLHWQTQELESTFSRISPDRTEEVLTARQRFSSRGMGASAVWQPSGEPGGGWLVGGDWRRAAWSGREQDLAGVFAQRDFAVSDRFRVLATGRADLWENAGTEWSFNPRLGAVYRAAPTVVLRSSAYRSFRAPTLNELYRPFRVGNVETLANPELDAERLWGAEAGIDWTPRPRALVRVNAFWNELDGPVGNVTLEVAPEGILRQRRNLSRVTVRGAEAEATVGLGPATLRLSYLYSRSEVAETRSTRSARSGQARLRLPQAPEHSASAALSWRGPVPGSLQARWLGRQYEDDLNQLALPAALVVDLYVERELVPGKPRGATLFVAAENLLDEEVVTGRLPEERLGAPRTVQVGVRLGSP